METCEPKLGSCYRVKFAALDLLFIQIKSGSV